MTTYEGFKDFVPFWEDPDDPLAWDTVILAGEVFPGVARVGGSGIKRKIDVKKAKGKDKASLSDEGLEPATIEIELLIYNNQDWQRLQHLIKLITPRKPGGLRTPFTIVHPLTTLLSIQRIYVNAVPVPEIDKTNGFLRFKFSAIEWIPKPPPAKGVGGAGAGSNVKSKYEEELNELADKAAALASEASSAVNDYASKAADASCGLLGNGPSWCWD